MHHPVGYTLRREIADDLIKGHFKPDFLELAPENWIGIGGIWKRKLDQLKERYVMTSHGLSLSIGSPDHLDVKRLKIIKQFLDEYGIEIYSEHLAFSTIDNAHLYESMPIPFTLESLNHISEKVRLAQDILERPLVLENVCYYLLPESDFEEVEYISELQKRTNCGLLLDVSNVYVNATNHGYNIHQFFDDFPFDKVHYIHIGSFDRTAGELIFDSHDRRIEDSTIEDLLDLKNNFPANAPICIERESNFTPIEDLVKEFNTIKGHFSNEQP